MAESSLSYASIFLVVGLATLATAIACVRLASINEIFFLVFCGLAFSALGCIGLPALFGSVQTSIAIRPYLVSLAFILLVGGAISMTGWWRCIFSRCTKNRRNSSDE